MERLLSKKIAYGMFGVFGAFTVFLWKTEKDLADQGNILWTSNYVWGTLLLSLFTGAALGASIAFIFYRIAENRWRFRFSSHRMTEKSVGVWRNFHLWAESLKPRTVFAASLLLILFSWLPAYLAYYPGICAYDTSVQLGQVVENHMIDHHPIAHTLIFKGTVILGRELLGNVNTGIAVYVALQMIFLGVSMAYALTALHWQHIEAGWRIAALLYCMIYPFHWFMSVSTTKDTIFSSFVLIFIVTLLAVLVEDRNDLRMKWQELLLAVSCIGMLLFRKNGKYAFMVLLFFMVLAFWKGRQRRRMWGRMLICCGGAFMAGILLLSVLFNVTKAEQGDRREMLSMPIQQLARVMVYHGGVGVMSEDDNTMDEAHKALINDFLLYESYQYYRPEFADPVKSNTNTYVVRYRTVEFVKTYFQLLRRYPGDFINAALALDAGYFYPWDITHAYVNQHETIRNLGYVQTRWDEDYLNSWGIYKDSKWESLHMALEKWSEDNAYLELPILKYLFVPGVWPYLYLLLFGWLMIKREFRLCLPLSLVLGYYLTLLLGPTVQLRYIYPVMIVFPFLALLCCRRTAARGMYGNVRG